MRRHEPFFIACLVFYLYTVYILYTVSQSISWNITNNASYPSLADTTYVMVNNKVYIFFGMIDESKLNNNIFIWKPITNFTEMINIHNIPNPFICQSQCAVVINNTLIYIVEQNGIHIFNTSNNLFIYKNNKITVPSGIGTKCSINGNYYNCTRSCTVTNNTHLFVIGMQNKIHIYNINKNIWYYGAKFPKNPNEEDEYQFSRSSCIYYKNNNKIYIFGGSYPTTNKYSANNKIAVYDIKLNKSSETKAKLKNYTSNSRAVLAINNKTYIIGGVNAYFELNYVQVFNPLEDKIESPILQTHLNHVRYGHIAIMDNIINRLIVFGGYGINGTIDNTIEVSSNLNGNSNNNKDNNIMFKLIIATIGGVVFITCILLIGLRICYKYKLKKIQKRLLLNASKINQNEEGNYMEATKTNTGTEGNVNNRTHLIDH